ncbi:MAG: GxxExxY protein [Syntrophobacteraceae bacterium]|nr:GxxExxY protein [Syntrophobacteraceae bacterium]
MKAEDSGYIDSDLTYGIIGCAMAVINELGHGLREKTYERAMCVEFKSGGFSFREQHVYPVYYRGQHIDDYIPDLEVENRIIVEVKTVEQISDEHIGQVLNYLKITGREAGLILNFKDPKLEWKRVVLQEGKKSK